MDSQSIQWVVGLRNPGQRYDRTRHNVGAWWVESWVESLGLAFRKVRYAPAEVVEVPGLSPSVLAFRSTTYMNDSGQAAGDVGRYRRLSPQRLLVVHDDLDLPVGVVRLKFDGGHGGHNGLRSIARHLQTSAFWRLRFGIGHPGHAQDVADYVLQAPPQAERQAIEVSMDRVRRVWSTMLSSTPDWQAVMRQLHTAEVTAQGGVTPE